MHQIKYLGLLDNIKVRRAGFAYRTLFAKFLERYGLLSKETGYAGKIIWKGDAIAGCLAIVKGNNVEANQYQIGKTKIFIRLPETLFALEELRERYWHNMVPLLCPILILPPFSLLSFSHSLLGHTYQGILPQLHPLQGRLLEPHQECLPKLQVLPNPVCTDLTRVLASLQGHVTLR